MLWIWCILGSVCNIVLKSACEFKAYRHGIKHSFQRVYCSENLIEIPIAIWKSLKPSLLMVSTPESMPYAATCQCVDIMVFVSCCLPVMFSTLQNFCWVYAISHLNRSEAFCQLMELFWIGTNHVDLLGAVYCVSGFMLDWFNFTHHLP